MFRLASVWRLTTLQHGSVFITSRQYCAVKSDVVDHSLRFTREILLRDTPHSVVAGFEQVKLREGVKPKTRQTLSRVWLDVEFAGEGPLSFQDISPTFLKCVEALLSSDEAEATDVHVSSVAVANLKRGLNQLVNPEGHHGLSDYALKALASASAMKECDANVEIVSELLLPLMSGFCVFNARHRSSLEKLKAHDGRLRLPRSLKWKGLALGSPMLWYGELDLLLCPDIDSVQKYGKFPVAVVKKGKGYFPEVSLAAEGNQKLQETKSAVGYSSDFSQAYATAIVFANLCHYKFDMIRSFIPTLLISPQCFAVFFYDCVADIMLLKYCLWSEYTLVFLWTVLHYPSFYPPSWGDLGIDGVPFGFCDNVAGSSIMVDDKEFHFGESLQSPVFKRANPLRGRPKCDGRIKPDKGIVLK